MNPLPRLVILRGLRSAIQAGSRQRIEIALCSEFNDPIHGLLRRSKIYASFHHSISEQELCPTNCDIASFGYRDEVGILEIDMPTSGMFHLQISADLIDEGAHLGESVFQMMLTIFTDMITIIPSGCEKQSVHMFATYRRLSSPGHTLIIQEDYGATLGSHIYDCSLVLLEFFNKELLSSRYCDHALLDGSVVELGSGCGLLGIWLNQHCKRVFLTDRTSQLALIRRNVLLNTSHAARCMCLALDWSDRDKKPLLSLQSALRNDAPLRVIIAADVLYDREAAAALFDVVDALEGAGEVSSQARILIAQKLRSDTLASDVDAISPKFTAKELCRQYGVRLLEYRRVL